MTTSAKSRLRIVIAKKLVSTVGGSESFARALDRELRARGHEVSLVGLRTAWTRDGMTEAVVVGNTRRDDFAVSVGACAQRD